MTSAAWRCPFCIEAEEDASIGDLRRAGIRYPEPTHPDAVCACGSRPPEAVQARLLLERLTRAVPAPSPASSERRPSSATGLGLNAAARRLHRSKATVARLIAEGAILTVPWPGRRMTRLVPVAEVERIEREGLALPGPTPVAPKRTRSRKNGTAAPRSEREAAVARILAVED